MPETVTEMRGVALEWNERLQVDPIGGSLGRALETWCTTRNVRVLRRALLQLLADLD